MFSILCFFMVCLVFVPQSAFAIGAADVLEGFGKVFNPLVGALMKGLELLVGLSQFLFLKVVEVTILNFAQDWTGKLSDFRIVWQVLRDFVNLVIDSRFW